MKIKALSKRFASMDPPRIVTLGSEWVGVFVGVI